MNDLPIGKYGILSHKATVPRHTSPHVGWSSMIQTIDLMGPPLMGMTPALPISKISILQKGGHTTTVTQKRKGFSQRKL